MRFPTVFAAIGLCAAAVSAQYCIPVTNNSCSGTGWEFINNVTIANVNNSTGCTLAPAYTDYTGTVAPMQLAPGGTYPVSVSIGNAFSSNYVYIMLDVDGDSAFTTAGEILTVMGPLPVGGGTQTMTGSITLPPAVAPLTKLRVRMSWGTLTSGQEPCGTTTFGETEDYDVATGGGPLVPEYQVNQPGSSLDVDGVAGGPFLLASKTVCTNITANVNLNSTAVSLPWDILISPIGPLTTSTGAITTANGQIVNCNLAATTFFLNLALNVPFVATTIPVNLPFPLDALLQMVNVDPSNLDGISLSQPNFFHVSAGALLVPGPTADDGVVLVTAGAPGQCFPPIPFYSQTYTQYHVCSNGRVMFQPPGAAAPATGAYQPVIGGALNETFAGFWIDFQPGTVGTGTIDITSPAPGLVSIVYNNQNYWGNPAILVSGSITFDTTNGAITLSGMATWPVFPVTSGTLNMCFMGVTPGVLGSTNGPATDAGPAAYSLGGSGGPVGPTSDMVYALGNPNLLSGNANSLVYVPNAMGNFFWGGF